MADPLEIGMIVTKDGNAFEFCGPELTVVLTNCRVVVVRFPESAVVAGLIGLPATGEKTAEMVARTIVVVKIAELRLDLVESS
jgi:hypothetical protein